MRVFIDSDVIISSLLSSRGAAFLLIHHWQIEPVISSVSRKEMGVVAERLQIQSEKLDALLLDHAEIHILKKDLKEIKREYGKFVRDSNDAHIVSGAHDAKTGYLVSYNLRHYKTDIIKNELKILVFSPALFLQYLRSQ